MRIRALVMACGMPAALLLSGAVLAQQQPADRDRTKPTDRTTEQRDRDRAKDWSVSQQAGPALLKDLQGVWKVEVAALPHYWKDGSPSGAAMRDNTPPPSDRDRVGGDGANQPGGTTPPAAAATTLPAGTPNYTGYAERKFVLGDRILEETVLIPDMKGAMGERGAKPSAATPSMAKDEFRGKSFLAFDDSGQNFTYVCMDTRTGKVHQSTGTYEAAGKRIVFDSRMMGMDKPWNERRDWNKPGEGAPAANPPTGRPVSPPGTEQGDEVTKPGGQTWITTGSGMRGDAMRVVVEILNPDQHRVTMYTTAPAMGYTTTTTSPTRGDATHDQHNDQPMDRPSATEPARPNQPGANNPARPTTTATAGMNSPGGTLIYQATYTRAKGEEGTRFQRMLERPTTGDGMRDNNNR